MNDWVYMQFNFRFAPSLIQFHPSRLLVLAVARDLAGGRPDAVSSNDFHQPKASLPKRGFCCTWTDGAVLIAEGANANAVEVHGFN